MGNLFLIIGLVAFVLLFTSLFKSQISLFFSSDQTKRKKGLSAITYPVLFVSCLILLPGCGSKTQKGETTDSEATESVEAEPRWAYSSSTDEMTGKEMFFAETESTNEFEFEFPYNGGSRMYLMIRNMNGENEVLVRVSKGQFNLSVNGNENIRIKYGDEEPVAYGYATSTNAAPDIIFVDRAADIIKKLKTAKEVKIDAPFYQAGRVVFNFDVSGLEWDK